MRVEILPAISGWVWLRDGFKLTTRRPGLLLSLLISMLFAALVIGMLQPVGEVLIWILLPLFWMILMHAARQLDEEREYFFDLKEIFNGRVQTLLLIGLVQFLLAKASLWSTVLLDGGTLIRFLGQPVSATGESAKAYEELAQQIRIIAALPSTQMWLILNTLQMLLFWFVPMLATWPRFGIGKALFYNFYAFRRNWRAFLVNGVLVLLITEIVIGVAFLILPTGLRGVGSLIFFGFFLPVFVGSVYVSYRRIFIAEEQAPEPPIDSQNEPGG